MKDMPKISAAEWEVMKLLWKENPLTSEKIINSLTEKMDWSTQTVKTFDIKGEVVDNTFLMK